MRLGIEYIDKAFAYYFALALRVGDSGEFAKELGTCIDAYHIESQTFIIVKNVLKLVFAKHTVVNENTRQIFAYCSIKQHCRYR